MMQKRNVCILLLILLLIGASISYAESPWQVLVYMVTSDLEDGYGLATADLEEMCSASANFPELELFVCTGGSQTYNTCAVWQIKNGLKTLLTDLGERNMGDVETLQMFFQSVPICANHKALIFWNHGRPLIGLGKDLCFDGEALDLLELKTALAYGPRWNLIAFDACMMASVETALAVNGKTDYLVASQETIQQQGYNYVRMLSELIDSASGEEAGKRFCSAYQEEFLKEYQHFPEFAPAYTLSCMKLDELESVQATAEELFTQLDNGLQLGSFPSASRIRDTAAQPGRFSVATEYDQIDLMDWCKQYASLFPEETNAVQAALESFLVANVTNMPDFHGISIYFPCSNDSLYKSYRNLSTQLSLCEAFSDFLKQYTKIRQNRLGAFNTPIIIQTDENQQYHYQLSPEQKEVFLRGAAFLYAKDLTGVYSLLGTQKQLEADPNGLLSYSFTNEAVYLYSPVTDEKGLVPLYDIQQESNGLQRASSYAIFVTPDGRFTRAQLELVMQNGKVQLVGLHPREEYATGKSTLRLGQFSEVILSAGGFEPAYSANGDALPFAQWKNANSMKLAWLSLDDAQLIMAPYSNDEELYLQFQLLDVYGDIHASELIQIQAP